MTSLPIRPTPGTLRRGDGGPDPERPGVRPVRPLDRRICSQDLSVRTGLYTCIYVPSRSLELRWGACRAILWIPRIRRCDTLFRLFGDTKPDNHVRVGLFVSY